MKRVLLFLLISFSFTLYSNTFKIALGTSGNEYGQHIIETSDKGFLLVGYATGGAAVGEDGLVIKLDQQGSVKWSKRLSNAGNDRLYGCIEKNNNYYVVGRTTSSTNGGTDGWCVKLDTLGNTIWDHKLGGTTDDGVYKIISLGGDRLMLTGYHSGSTGEQYAYMYIVKIRENGTVLWENRYQSTSIQTNTLRSCILTPTGNVILSDYTYCFGAGGHDAAAIAIDTVTGTRLWTRSYGNTRDDGFNLAINTKDANALFSGGARLDGATTQKYWVCKVNLSGDTLWQKSYYQSTAGANYTGCIATADDNGYIIGLNEGSASNVGLKTNLVKIDALGNILWTKTFDGPGDETFNSILTTSDNHFIAMGQTNSFGNGGYDIFVVKTNNGGNLDSCCVHSTNTLVKHSRPIVGIHSQNRSTVISNTVYAITNNSIILTIVNNCIPPLNLNPITQTNVTCYGLSDGAATVSILNGTPNFTYNWNTSPVQTSSTATNLLAGTYTVTVTDQLNCIKTATVTITEPPVLNSTIISSSNINCYGANNGTINALATGGMPTYNYSWNTNPIQNNANATGLSAGSYICTIIDANGCIDSISQTITEPPPINLSASFTAGRCDRDNTASAVVSGGTPAYSYFWNTIPTQTTATINVPVGTYMVTVTDANGCTQLQNINVVNPNITPTSGFTVDPKNASIVEAPLFTFTDNSTNSNNWFWDFGDGTTSSIQSPTHVYTNPGTYCIKQLVINMPSGCKDSIEDCITLLSDWTFYVPNAFTPNGNGVNDTFGAKATGIRTYKMLIFNRWGNMIFESNDLNKGWDGRLSGGEIAKEDVYVYSIYIIDSKNTEHKFIGHFTLVK